MRVIPSTSELDTLREAGTIASNARNWAAEAITEQYMRQPGPLVQA